METCQPRCTSHTWCGDISGQHLRSPNGPARPELAPAALRIFLVARLARDQKNSPSRLRFRPLNRPTFGFRLRPPGWASIYSRSVLGANGTVEASSRPFKACPNADVAICKVFSFQHFPHPDGRFCGQVWGISWTGASARPRNVSDAASRARGRTRTGEGCTQNLMLELDITLVTVHRLEGAECLVLAGAIVFHLLIALVLETRT
jgi:hypothetical protein